MRSLVRFLLSVGLGLSLLLLVAVGFGRRPANTGVDARERTGMTESRVASNPVGSGEKRMFNPAPGRGEVDLGEAERLRAPGTREIREFWDRIVREFGRENRFPYAETSGVDVHMRFHEEKRYFLREARLLALAYPELAMEWAKELIQGADRPPAERVYGIYTLGYLGAQGSREAAEALEAVAREGDWQAANIAVRLLASFDGEGRHESVVLHWAQEGYPRVIEILGDRYSDARRAVLEQILKRRSEWRRYPLPRQDAAIYAEQAHAKLEILLSPERDEVVRSILEDRQENRFQRHEWRRWALRVARSIPLPSLKEILRRRLDINEERHRQYFAAYPSEALNNGLERSFERGDRSVLFLEFDDILVHYWELGGELNELERKRLRYAGYACDAAQRLAELVREGRR